VKESSSRDWGSIPDWIQVLYLVLFALFALLLGKISLPPWAMVLSAALAVLIPLIVVGISSRIRSISFRVLLSHLVQRVLSRSWVGSLSRLFVSTAAGGIALTLLRMVSTDVEYQWTASIGVAIASWLTLGFAALGLGVRRLDTLATEVYTLRDTLWKYPDPGLEWWIWQVRFADELERSPLPESVYMSGPDTHVEIASCIGVSRKSIFQHPPHDGQTDAILRFSEPVTRKVGHLVLTFHTGIKDSHVLADGSVAECEFQSRTGNRIRFQVYMDGRLVFQEIRDSREWRFHALVLPPTFARFHQVEFRTNALGQPHCNWAVWGEPRLADWAAVFEDVARLQSSVDLSAKEHTGEGIPHRFEVPAHLEAGIDTGLALAPGQQFTIDATGKVSIDGGQTWMGPDGIVVQGPNEGQLSRGISTYFNDQADHGPIGALVAWIGQEREAASFLVGSQCVRVAERSGNLHLGVNDTKGAYRDNTDKDGQPTYFTVFVEVYPVRRD